MTDLENKERLWARLAEVVVALDAPLLCTIDCLIFCAKSGADADRAAIRALLTYAHSISGTAQPLADWIAGRACMDTTEILSWPT